MARSTRRKGKTENGERDDDYYAEQWEKLREQDAERAERRKRIWLERFREEQERARYTPWLVIPAVLSDYGQRPLAPGLAHWQSPHLGVFSPDPSGIALAGAQNTVWARVFNLGAMTSAPTRVRFFWADPSVGLGAADAHFIGETMVEVPRLRSVLVQCPTPWVPAYLNNGHECLFADAGNQIFDPVTAPFAPRDDRHVGQRNIQVLPAVDQTMMLWLPGGAGAFRAELRAMALRVQARDLEVRRSPVETLAQIADAVQMGFGTARHRGPRIAAKRVAADAAIRDLGLTGETRKVRDERALLAGESVEDVDRFGERVLSLKTEPGLHQQVKVGFQDLDLPRNEVMLIQFTWLAEGRLVGGYTVTLAAREWFDPDRQWKPKEGGKPMAETYDNGETLRDLVIRHNPQAQATFELARQLHDRLPLKSAEELSDGLKLGDAYLSPELLNQLAEPLFPIETPEDLVKRIAAMLRMFAAHAAANPASLSPEEMLLHDRLTGARTGEAVRQVLVARGEPIFTLPPEEKE